VLNFARHLQFLLYSRPLQHPFFPSDLQTPDSNTSLLTLDHTSLQDIVDSLLPLPSFLPLLQNMACTCSLLHSCNKFLHHITAAGLTFAGVVALLLACSRICRFTADLFGMSEFLGFVAKPLFVLVSFEY